jgi:hypothetical protein
MGDQPSAFQFRERCELTAACVCAADPSEPSQRSTAESGSHRDHPSTQSRLAIGHLRSWSWRQDCRGENDRYAVPAMSRKCRFRRAFPAIRFAGGVPERHRARDIRSDSRRSTRRHMGGSGCCAREEHAWHNAVMFVATSSDTDHSRRRQIRVGAQSRHCREHRSPILRASTSTRTKRPPLKGGHCRFDDRAGLLGYPLLVGIRLTAPQTNFGRSPRASALWLEAAVDRLSRHVAEVPGADSDLVRAIKRR